MKPRPIPALLVFLVSAASVTPAVAQTTPLHYQWKQGDILTYRTVVKTVSTSTGAPTGPATFEQTLAQTLRLTVAAVDPEGTATIRQSIEAVHLKVVSPMGTVEYDSARALGEDPDPRVLAMSKTVGGMIGEAISVTMTATGVVRRIDGAARIMDKLINNLPRDPMSGGLAQNIKSMLSDEALRSSLEQSFSRMPDQPIKIGDSWTAEQTVGTDAIGKVIGKSTFTLKAIEGTGDAAVARITVSLALRQENVPTGGASAIMKLGPGSQGTGELVFSIGRGRIETNSMQTEMPSTVTMRGPEGGIVTMQNQTRTAMNMEIVK